MDAWLADDMQRLVDRWVRATVQSAGTFFQLRVSEYFCKLSEHRPRPSSGGEKRKDLPRIHRL